MTGRTVSHAQAEKTIVFDYLAPLQSISTDEHACEQFLANSGTSLTGRVQANLQEQAMSRAAANADATCAKRCNGARQHWLVIP